MKEEWSDNEPIAEDESDTDINVVSLLKGMQQQLNQLERKVDLLINQSQKRSSGERSFGDKPFQKRPFSKPFRSSEHSMHHGKGEYGRGPRDRDSAQGHFYEHRPHKKGPRPGLGKKSFSFKRKDDE
jgi:hypothetical protein